jgi:hypothetical protein
MGEMRNKKGEGKERKELGRAWRRKKIKRTL